MNRLFSVCAALIAIGASTLVRAEDLPGRPTELRPIFAIGTSSYGQLTDDLAGLLPNSGQNAAGVEALIQFYTGGQGLSSVDRKKPWGAAAFLRGEELEFLAFVPTRDPKELLGALSAIFAAPREHADGILETRWQDTPLFLKQQGDWTYLATSREGLRELPKDPTPLLAGLNKEYDLAASLRPDGLGPGVIEPGLREMRKVIETGLSKRYRNESDEEYAKRKSIAEENSAWVSSLLQDLKHATVGLDLDGKAGLAAIEGQVAAREGSNMAKSLVPAPAKTRFAGFAPDNAVVGINQSGQGMAEVMALAALGADSLVQGLIDQLGEANENSDGLSSTIAEQMGELFQVAMSRGASDMGMGLLGAGPFTLVVGADLGDPDRVSAAAQAIRDKLGDRVRAGDVELHEEEGISYFVTYLKLPEPKQPQQDGGAGFPFDLLNPPQLRIREPLDVLKGSGEGAEGDIQLGGNENGESDAADEEKPGAAADEETDEDAALSGEEEMAQFSFPMFDPREAALDQLRMMFGEEFPVVVAHGNGCCYVAAGEQALKRLKTAIAASAKPNQPLVAGMRATVRPLLLLRRMAAVDSQNFMMQALVMMAGQPGESDRVRFRIVPTPEGAKYRLEAESGVMKILPLAAVYLMSNGLGGNAPGGLFNGGGFAP